MAAAIAVGVGGATTVALYGVPVVHRWLAQRQAPLAPRGT
jgi:hypothetical protein